MGNQHKTLIVVAGPTAVGKTATAIELARHYQTSIISADSRQFYREMSIGTAKPTAAELALAPHYFINTHSVSESFNVADYEKLALQTIDQIFTYGDVAILAGGSGLFIKAVCEGFDDIPDIDPRIREKLNEAYADQGIIYLQDRLMQADPLYFSAVDTSNPQRMIRALEVIEGTGQPFSSFRKAQIRQRPFNIVKIGLNLPRELLYQRINQRVDMMISDGLVDEVRSLLPYRTTNALQTVGYKEVLEYLDGEKSLAAAIELVKQNTRRFAKRQLTWFNRDAGIHWFEPQQLEPIINYIDNELQA
jgi:tRNA dimethylallyltransferase